MDNKPIKVLELFAGIGACSKALTNLGIDHEIVDAVEIDKYAVSSFNAVHGTEFKPQDISKWDKNIECDLIMHGSPCQDFSIAGKQAGGDEGTGTRSSLMYETLRIVGKLEPKYVIWENVKNLLSKTHKHNFDAYIEAMDNLGYNSYYKVLNAKNYGLPQNRERVFTVSVRKDICGPMPNWFSFPEPVELTKSLRDLLEDDVDEKFFLTDEQVKGILAWNYNKSKQFYDPDGISPTLDTMTGGNRQPKIVLKVKTATNKGYDEATDGDGIDLKYPNSDTRRGRVGHGVSKTIMASAIIGCVDGTRIRKLTPKECWRLMGFSDNDFDKAKKVNSNSQLYKQAGNSICVPVLEGILKELLNGS